MADSFLSRSRTIAGPGFNRWLVPPAALCIHLCIGQVYAFSVFNLPLTKLLGISQSAPGDWKLTDVGWIFSIAIVCPGRLRRGVRALGRGRRTAARHVHGRPVLWSGLRGLGRGRQPASAVAGVPGVWGAGRMRARAGLHLAGLHADQVVSGPARAWPPAWPSWASAAAPSSPRPCRCG